MKYWIFQSNQVLGPYEPDDLSKHSAFGAESLVCPEGRRGTSMGDWQRAGMVPDLSVALVRASQAHGMQSSVATLAGLPPEPTLKDLAVLGSLQEKMSMMEDVVLQLQESLRVKDAELAALHQELQGKDRQSSVMKSAMEQEAADLKAETEERKREAEDLQAQTTEFKRQMAELQERLGVVNRLSETIDKAVEAEKHVEHDVEAQGAALAGLTKEIESLRAQLTEKLSAASGSAPAPVFAPASSSSPAPAPAPDSVWAPSAEPSAATPPPEIAIEIPGGPSAAADLPNMAPTPAPAPAAESPALPPGSPFSPFGEGAMPSFGSPSPEGTMSIPMDPMAAASSAPSDATPASAAEPVPADAAAAPAAGGRKKALMMGGLLGVVVLGALAFVSTKMGKKKPAVSVADTAPLPTPPAPVVVAPPPPPPAPPVDPRETAIEAAKDWVLPDGRKLGGALETLSPPIGNLSPWMAEPLANDRVSVNYFAHGGGSGAPTVAYEFEVDLAAKTVMGRNPAAKAVIAGKAVRPPAPPKPKRVTLKPKAKAKAPKAAPAEDNLDSLLGGEPAPAAKGGAPLALPGTDTAPEDKPAAKPSADAPDDDSIAPGDEAPAKPAKPTAAKRAAKASAKAAPAADDDGKASDEALLDDVLKE